MACDDCNEVMTWEERRVLSLQLAVQSFPPGDSRGPVGIVHAAEKFFEYMEPPDIEGIIHDE